MTSAEANPSNNGKSSVGDDSANAAANGYPMVLATPKPSTLPSEQEAAAALAYGVSDALVSGGY
jgi:hypothetical protein